MGYGACLSDVLKKNSQIQKIGIHIFFSLMQFHSLLVKEYITHNKKHNDIYEKRYILLSCTLRT